MPILNQKIKKHLIMALDVIGIFLVLMAISFFVRLYYGAINANFLKPYIIHSISSDAIPFDFDIGNVKLEWGRGKRIIDITANDLTVKDKDGINWAVLPKVAIVLNIKNIMRGEITPHLIDIVAPFVTVYLEEDNNFSFIIGKNHNDNQQKKMSVEEISALFSGFFDKSSTEEFKQKDLELILISNAELDFIDLVKNQSLNFKNFSFEFSKKDSTFNLAAIFNLDFLGQDSFITISSIFDSNADETEISIRFNQFKPSYFAEFITGFKNIDLSLGGNVALAIKTKFLENVFFNENDNLNFLDYFTKDTITMLDFDLYSGAGLLTLPEPLFNQYVLFSSFLKGRIEKNLNNLVLERLEADFGSSKTVLSGSILNLADKITNSKQALEISFTTEVKSLLLDDLKKYWPSKIIPETRDWVTNNLKFGEVKNANFSFGFTLENDAINLDILTGKANIHKANVNYLDGMPEIFDANGVVIFAKDKIDIEINSGKTYNLNIGKGFLSFYDFDKEISQAKINLDISGCLYDALKITDSNPLELLSSHKIDKEGFAGNADINLDLAFPFLDDLKGENIAVTVKANIKDAFIPKALDNNDLSQGNLELFLNNDFIEIKGEAKIMELAARVSFLENFSQNQSGVKSHKTIGVKLTESDRERLELNVLPFVKPYFEGDIDAEVAITHYYNGENFIGVRADLTNSFIAIPMLGWHKKKQSIANAIISARLLQNGSLDVSKFTITSGEDFNLQGSFVIKPNKTFDKITFSKFNVGRTDVQLIFTQNKDEANINIAGKSFDFNHIFKDATGFGDKNSSLPDMNLNIAVKTMWGSLNGNMQNVGAVLKRNNNAWQNIEVAGDFETGEKVLITMLPDSQNGHSLFIETRDAGSFFKTFGILDNIKSGYLRLEGYSDNNGKFEGSLRMKDYRLIKAPLLARVLTMAALTGFADILSGGGIAFSQMDLPFIYQDGLLEIKETKTSGNSLGITAKGFVDIKNNNVALEGLIAPAYVISRIIGNIPIIGKLFVGKDEGGVFAVSYNIKGERENPEITVNPLSALAPGFLRDLFGNLIPK